LKANSDQKKLSHCTIKIHLENKITSE